MTRSTQRPSGRLEGEPAGCAPRELDCPISGRARTRGAARRPENKLPALWRRVPAVQGRPRIYPRDRGDDLGGSSSLIRGLVPAGRREFLSAAVLPALQPSSRAIDRRSRRTLIPYARGQMTSLPLNLSIAALFFAIALILIVGAGEIFARTLRCDWCSRPYALWRRCGGRVCRGCRRQIAEHVRRQLYRPTATARARR